MCSSCDSAASNKGPGPGRKQCTPSVYTYLTKQQEQSKKMALHKFTLEANMNVLEMRLSKLASECFSCKCLDLLPDIAAPSGEATHQWSLVKIQWSSHYNINNS